LFNKAQKKFFLISRETSILINNLFMMYFLSVVLIGTVYPIFLEVLSGEKISVGPPFYHKLIIPFLFLSLIESLILIAGTTHLLNFNSLNNLSINFIEKLGLAAS